MIIAIDGPAGVGKGTLARKVADYMGLPCLDTGLLYRAVAFKMLQDGITPENLLKADEYSQKLRPQDIDAPQLRNEEVGSFASVIASYPGVRAALLQFQRDFAAKGGVLDGRDIGTIVCPQADFKIYLTASLQSRVHRRVKELQEGPQKGIQSEDLLKMVFDKIVERDQRDANRATSPMIPAQDALVLDTSDLDADAVFLRVVEHINKRLSRQAS